MQEKSPTKQSDCYELGMLAYEILSGQRPFATRPNDTTILQAVLGGEQPRRPQGKEGILFTDDIWDTLKLCWKHKLRDRITASAVLQRLEEHPPLLMPPSNVGGDVEM